MATLTAEADTLATKLHDTSAEFKTLCKQWLNESMMFILSKRPDWEFLEAEGELTTVANQESYNYSTDFGNSDLHKVTAVRTDEDQNIKLVSVEDLERHMASSGLPYMAAEWAGTLRFFPTPADVRTFTWRGYVRQDELADGDAPPWEAKYNPIWRLGAEALGLKYLDDARASQYWAMFFNQVSNMFGDNGVEDEEIVCEPFSTYGQRTSVVDPHNGAVWP